MTHIEEDSGLSRDEEDVEILQTVREILSKNGAMGVTSIGPFNARNGTLTVLYAQERDTKIPDAIEVTLSNKKTITLKLVAKRESKPAVLLFSSLPAPPWQYSGPLMGGDPLWNDASPNFAGTITFAVPQASSITIEGNACSNQSVTCHHVLSNSSGSKRTSTTRYPGSMKLKWEITPPTGTKWIDIASAEIKPGTPYSPLEVRGLRKIKGVKQPASGIRVSKYGRTTGLTSGRDLGWVLLQPTTTNRDSFWLRCVSGYFADVGDSGAAVLDADRNLVGIVVSGRPGELDQTYYIQALPKGQRPSPRASGAAAADLSCFEIDGL
jgi:hypothetical protein